MEQFIVSHADEMGRWPRLAWADVYGAEWQTGAANLGRYFAKQVGCMLATQRLPIPNDLINFLNGAPRCPSVTFVVHRNWRAIDAHRMLRTDGFGEGITTFVGLPQSNAYQRDGKFSGVDYGYHIGYIWFRANWSKDTDRAAWWEYPVIKMPLESGDLVSKIEWRTLWARTRLQDLASRLTKSGRRSTR
ncbi:hypothetical protein [Kocuria sp. KRD140]|uniref:hypothetical protein n=1 Tax=Kocuria sp. KRD140 TaxID=2729723 RepID=UPI0019D30F5D|nr:hypothetical protein [Kocuria sp. KRD140]